MTSHGVYIASTVLKLGTDRTPIAKAHMEPSVVMHEGKARYQLTKMTRQVFMLMERTKLPITMALTGTIAFIGSLLAHVVVY